MGKRTLRAALLAGGGDTSNLPTGLKDAADFDRLPQAERAACVKIRNPLIAVAVEFSKQPIFREELLDVISVLGTSDGAREVLSPTHGGVLSPSDTGAALC